MIGPQEGRLAVEARLPGYEKADAYARGEVGEVFASRRVRRAIAKTGSEYQCNFAAVPIKALVALLKIKTVTAGDPTVDEQLAAIRERNELRDEEDEAHRNAAKHGDCYLMVWPDERGEVDITVESALGCTMIYDAERPREKLCFVKQWSLPKRPGDRRARIRVNLMFDDRIEKWVTDGTDREGWEPHVDRWRAAEPGEVIFAADGVTTILADAGEPVPDWPLTNPYGRVCAYHLRNERPYGVPEHLPAYGPQNIITKIVVTHPNVIETSGWPQRWKTAGQALGTETADFDDVPDVGDEVDDITVADAGSIFNLEPGAKVGQFDPADPAAFLDPLKAYIEVLAALTDTPLSRFRGSAQLPAEASTRAEAASLYEKGGIRQRQYGAQWSAAYETALLMYAVEDAVAGEPADGPDGGYGWDDIVDAARDVVDTWEPPTVVIDWITPEMSSDNDTADTVQKADSARAMSTREKVRRLHPNWEGEQVDEEVALILAEDGADPPSDDDGTAPGPGDPDRDGDDGLFDGDVVLPADPAGAITAATR